MEKKNKIELYSEIRAYLYELTDELKMPEYNIDGFLKEFNIKEKGETTLSGDKRDWIAFMLLIILSYSDY